MRQPVLSGTVSGPSRKRIFQSRLNAWDPRRLLEGLQNTGTQVLYEILSQGFLCCHHTPQSAEYGIWRAVFPGVSPLSYTCAGWLMVFKKVLIERCTTILYSRVAWTHQLIFVYPACRGQGKTELALTTDNCIRPAHIRRSLLLLYILRPACGTDGFSSRAFVDVTALCAPVPVPFQFIHLKVRGTANRTHTASPPYHHTALTWKTWSFSHRMPLEWGFLSISCRENMLFLA